MDYPRGFDAVVRGEWYSYGEERGTVHAREAVITAADKKEGRLTTSGSPANSSMGSGSTTPRYTDELPTGCADPQGMKPGRLSRPVFFLEMKEPQPALYAGFSHVAYRGEPLELGHGVALRSTYAHLFAANMMAFARAEGGRAHPGPWRAARGGYGYDIEVEIAVSNEGSLPANLSREDTVWQLRLFEVGTVSLSDGETYLITRSMSSKILSLILYFALLKLNRASFRRMRALSAIIFQRIWPG